MRLLETKDHWDQAWERAAIYRDASIELGLVSLFTVRAMRVPRTPTTPGTVYGVYMLESGDDALVAEAEDVA